MPHLDEGTLHALLDGELELDEVKEIQTHLGTCAACGSRLQDVKQFLAEADSLVGALETPAGAPKVRREPAPPPRSPLPPSRGEEPWREPVWDSSPKILLPDDMEENTRRRRWMVRMRWAAMIVLVLGVGQLARSMFTPKRPELQLYEPDVSSATPTTPPAVDRWWCRGGRRADVGLVQLKLGTLRREHTSGELPDPQHQHYHGSPAHAHHPSPPPCVLLHVVRK